jgi:photosystem II stability/assembly factor-like uncharacterized protein
LFPWERVLRSDDGGRTWTSYDGPRRPWAYLDAGAVLPDGRLVVDVVSWSDARAGRPSRHSVGLFTGSDWSRPLPPAGGGPQPTVLATVVRADVVSMWVSTSDGLRRTDDGGETWHAERAR